MFRIFFIFGLLAIVEPFHNSNHRHGHHHNHNHHYFFDDFRNDPETELRDIERKFIESEDALENFCKNNLNNGTKELYGMDNYFLKHNIPEAKLKNSKVTVQIKKRLIYTKVEENNGGNYEKVFQDVRKLPDIVKAEDAVWSKERKDTIKISIPYKVPLGTEIVKDCGVIDNGVIDVPAVVYPSIIPRNDNDSTED